MTTARVSSAATRSVTGGATEGTNGGIRHRRTPPAEFGETAGE